MNVRTFQRHVPGAPQAVMALLMDAQRRPAWLPGVQEVLHVSDPALCLGSAWIEERGIGNRVVRLSARVIEFHPPHVVAYALSGKGLDATVRWSTRLDEGRTLLVQDIKVKTSGLRALWSDLQATFLGQQRGAMEGLRDLLAHPTASDMEGAYT